MFQQIYSGDSNSLKLICILFHIYANSWYRSQTSLLPWSSHVKRWCLFITQFPFRHLSLLPHTAPFLESPLPLTASHPAFRVSYNLETSGRAGWFVCCWNWPGCSPAFCWIYQELLGLFFLSFFKCFNRYVCTGVNIQILVSTGGFCVTHSRKSVYQNVIWGGGSRQVKQNQRRGCKGTVKTRGCCVCMLCLERGPQGGVHINENHLDCSSWV